MYEAGAKKGRPNSMTELLSIKNLTKSYGEVKALRELSCTLHTGIHALLGPNGSGKSTLMHILTKNLKADSGEVLFCGREISAMGKDYRGRIGFVPQEAGLPAGFTLLEFLMYMACLKGIPRKNARLQAEDLMVAVDLADCKNRKVNTFSGGMKQRALLAQAMLGQPDLLILDEPTAGLDPLQRLRVKNLLFEYGREHCILLATHIVSDIQGLSPRFLFLKKGELKAEGDLETLQASLAGMFWEIPREKYDPSYSVIRHMSETVRVFCETKPCNVAVSVSPSVEDCYYYYFGETGT